MEFILSNLWSGISYGLLLFMLTSGLTLIFSLMGVLNFAHASFYMLGAYFAYQLSIWLNFWLALFLTPLLVGFLGSMTEKYFLRRLHKYGPIAELLFTFGLAFLIAELVHLIWGRSSVNYQIPQELEGSLFTIYETSFPTYKGFMMLVSITMLLALYLLIYKTRIGLIIKASLTQPKMVEALGHNVPRIFTWVFGAGVGLAALAGVIGGNALITEPGMANTIGSIIFVIVVIGGLGSLTGAFIASIFIGIAQNFLISSSISLSQIFNFMGLELANTSSIGRITLTEFAPIFPYLLMIIFLTLKPNGIFGNRAT